MGKAVRWSIIGVLVAMIVGLSFGLGFVLRMAFEDDSPSSTAVRAASTTTDDGDPDFTVLNEIYDALQEHYIEPTALDADVVRTGAINGVINAIGDTHQAYITREARVSFEDDTNGQFEGIGATVDRRNGEIIVNPYNDSPARRAGVRPQDVVLEVDGESTSGWTTQTAVSKIRGKRGTEVKLKVRHTDNTEEVLTVVRDRILVDSVKVSDAWSAQDTPAPDIAYIRIENFSARTIDELRTALRNVRNGDYKGLVLDLRNNPGGLLDSVEQVTSQFLGPDKPILIEQRRNGAERVNKSRGSGLAVDIPLAVLVNHNSASASEILAGALRDNKRAVVIGEATFGKGTVNLGVPLSDGGLMYVTVGRWLTPQRDIIEGAGIKPDITVTAADNEDPLSYYNAVMYRAVQYLRTGS